MSYIARSLNHQSEDISHLLLIASPITAAGTSAKQEEQMPRAGSWILENDENSVIVHI